MPEMSRKHQYGEAGSTGFILLEALIAMGLITASFMVAITSYHSLVLQWGQLQDKRVQIRKEWDQIEIDRIQPVGVANELIGVSSRPRFGSDSGKSNIANQLSDYR